MQESRSWLPPTGTLGTILEATRRRLPTLDRAPTASTTGQAAPTPSLKSSLSTAFVAVIAEIKRRSPSKGELNGRLDAGAQAAAFERGGAAAISVLTEPEFFGGSIDDLVTVRASVGLPVLKKDFHVDRSQLEQASHATATAVLLIARALSPTELPELMRLARAARLETVVEVRSEQELKRALDAGAEIVGVNSRDLETLAVDASVPERLVPLVPPHVVAIWESGVSSVDDVQRAARCGADAVLVGSALSRAADPESLLRALTSVRRRPRG